MKTMPSRSVSVRSRRRNAAGAGTKPPSPCCGSMSMAATWSGTTRVSKSSSSASSAVSVVQPRYSSGNGAWWMSGANGPKFWRYAGLDDVMVRLSSVRPWNPPLNATTAGRFVYARATLIAFSIASVPVVKSTAL